MYGKSNMGTYITICKIDSQREFAVCQSYPHLGGSGRSSAGWSRGGCLDRGGGCGDEPSPGTSCVPLRWRTKDPGLCKENLL